MYKVQEPERSWQNFWSRNDEIQAHFYCICKHQAFVEAHGLCDHLSFTTVHTIEIRKQFTLGKKVSDPRPSYSVANNFGTQCVPRRMLGNTSCCGLFLGSGGEQRDLAQASSPVVYYSYRRESREQYTRELEI